MFAVGSRSDPKELPATRPHPAGHGLDLDLNENPLDCRAHHRLHRFWLSDLHWSDTFFGAITFFEPALS